MSRDKEGLVPDRLGGEFTKIPDWLARVPSRELSPGAKLIYARLVRYGRSTGVAFPRQETLGRELGLSRRQVVDYLRTLKEVGLIATRRVGQGRPNEIRFLEHRWMVAADAQHAAHQDENAPARQDERHGTLQGVRDAAPLDERHPDVQDARPSARQEGPGSRIPREDNFEETSPRPGGDGEDLIEKVVARLGEHSRSQTTKVISLLLGDYDRRFVEQVVNFAVTEGGMGRSPLYLMAVADNWLQQRTGQETDRTEIRAQLRAVR